MVRMHLSVDHPATSVVNADVLSLSVQALRLQRKLADEELGIREVDEPSARDVLVKCAYVLCCVLTTHRLLACMLTWLARFAPVSSQPACCRRQHAACGAARNHERDGVAAGPEARV
jgi:hypothetical protein